MDDVKEGITTKEVHLEGVSVYSVADNRHRAITRLPRARRVSGLPFVAVSFASTSMESEIFSVVVALSACGSGAWARAAACATTIGRLNQQISTSKSA